MTVCLRKHFSQLRHHPIVGWWLNQLVLSNILFTQLCIPWRPQRSRTYFFYFSVKVWGISRARLFPRTSRLSIRSASFGEARVTTRSTGRARGLTGWGARRSQLQQQPICWLFYRRLAATNQRARPLAPDSHRGVLLRSGFFRSTLGLRAPPETDLLVSPGSRLLANSDFVAMGRRVLTLAQCGRPSAQGQEGGDTSSPARCHQDTPGTPWELREPAKATRPQTPRTFTFSFTYSFFLSYCALLFY